MKTTDYLRKDGIDRKFVRVFTAQELGAIQAIFQYYAASCGFELSEDEQFFCSFEDSDSIQTSTNSLFQAFNIFNEDYEG